MHHSPDERIDILETKLTFQEDTISALNNALISQQSRIDHLEQMLQLMIAEMEDLKDGQEDPSEEPPPPHY